MSCEHLICAQCSGVVVEGRCPTCRAGRAQVHQHGPVVRPELIALLALLIVALSVLASHH